ncbi:hypothetical protein GLS40_06145 [Pseudooceanicola sp. 216_PA32_1]|uniref:DUF4274 domain-containing protein n=1 Tax=Pseudooceanicola pacificus TaxID=2676438 RepID=A0A844W1G6_9RHOB|nr:hypothetical protein [Pseudooceanicola pacificus]MWB77597.1 hypothetical protein [Pseudooceanicola pacificus]
MLDFADDAWRGMSEAEQLWSLKSMGAEALCDVARTIKWDETSMGLIGWLSAQRDLDLGSAMTLFLNCDAGRFNHLPKDEVAEADRRRCGVLDAICQRVNCGFYLPDPRRPLDDDRGFKAWMTAQNQNRRSCGKGRWIFNPVMVAPMVSEIRFEARQRRKFVPASGRRPGLLGGLISPFFA